MLSPKLGFSESHYGDGDLYWSSISLDVYYMRLKDIKTEMKIVDQS